LTAPKLHDTVDSELIEIHVKAHRRIIRRRRAVRTCNCTNVPNMVTAPTLPRIIPKSQYGISIWSQLLVNKFALHRSLENVLKEFQLQGLRVPAGTATDGLRRVAPLFTPIYEAIKDRNVESYYSQADESRWPVYEKIDGKTGNQWWLWAFLSQDTDLFLVDPFRNHDVPENYFPKDQKRILVVDRYSAYKAMSQVKSGIVRLAFCWAHVRRDFIEAAKGWPKPLTSWALEYLQLIREIYRTNRDRNRFEQGSSEYRKQSELLRSKITFLRDLSVEELCDDKLHPAKRKVLASLKNHWDGLTIFVDDPNVPMDNNASERRIRGPATGRKMYYGSVSRWSAQLAVMMFSIFGTFRLWGINPLLWLSWYLSCCAENGDSTGSRPPDSVEQFLPWNLSREQLEDLQFGDFSYEKASCTNEDIPELRFL